MSRSELSSYLPRRIIVSHRLPLNCVRDPFSRFGFTFSVDPDALPFQLSSCLSSSSSHIPPLFIGTIPFPPSQDPFLRIELRNHLRCTFNCIPVFIPANTYHRFYHIFCAQYLWPLFQSISPGSSSSTGGLPFNDSMYRSFLMANRMFSDQISDILHVDEDSIWILDFPFLALPTYLRMRFPTVKVGFFLHSPFPTYDIFRTIPVRDDLLGSILNSDLVGFHTSDYARLFLSSCLMVFGLSCHYIRGQMGINYHGRNVILKVHPVGVDEHRIFWILSQHETVSKIKELENLYKNQVLIVSVDDTDLYRAIKIKFLAMEQLLEDHPEWQGRVVLLQITNPAEGRTGRDVMKVRQDTYLIRDRINNRFGQPGYKPVVILDSKQVSMYEKAAYYAVAECCIANVVYDGMNRIPYTYTLCREYNPTVYFFHKKSVVVISEFMGYSTALNGSIKFNPWDIQSVSEGLITSIELSDTDKELRHRRHYHHIIQHGVSSWVESFDRDLERAWEDNSGKRLFSVGSDMSYHIVALESGISKLLVDEVVDRYKNTSNRLILLGYDGTMVPQGVTEKAPSDELIQVINGLCADPCNAIFVLSGRRREELAKWFEPCEKLGIAAEQGYFIRWDKVSLWENTVVNKGSNWRETVLAVMQQYTAELDGSCVEQKESALVWHYQDADPYIGSCMAEGLFENLQNMLANEIAGMTRGGHNIAEVDPQEKALLDNIDNILSNEPAVVKRGHLSIEVNPQGINKGVPVERIIRRLESCGNISEFVLCIGNDSSDEEMFEALQNYSNDHRELFACTVGIKPSIANYCVDDTDDVLKLLKALAEVGPIRV